MACSDCHVQGTPGARDRMAEWLSFHVTGFIAARRQRMIEILSDGKGCGRLPFRRRTVCGVPQRQQPSATSSSGTTGPFTQSARFALPRSSSPVTTPLQPSFPRSPRSRSASSHARSVALTSDATYTQAITTLCGGLNVEIVEQDVDRARRDYEGLPIVVHHPSRGEEWPAG